MSNDYLPENVYPVEDLLRDPENFDFRPRKGTPLVDQGTFINGHWQSEEINGNAVGGKLDIGAYEYGDVKYWIPGMVVRYPSVPIPADNSGGVGSGDATPTTGPRPDLDLIWLGGKNRQLHHVFFGYSETELYYLKSFEGDRNICFAKGTEAVVGNPLWQYKCLPHLLKPGEYYYWRVDSETSKALSGGKGLRKSPERGSGLSLQQPNKIDENAPKKGDSYLVGQVWKFRPLFEMSRSILRPKYDVCWRMDQDTLVNNDRMIIRWQYTNSGTQKHRVCGFRFENLGLHDIPPYTELGDKCTITVKKVIFGLSVRDSGNNLRDILIYKLNSTWLQWTDNSARSLYPNAYSFQVLPDLLWKKKYYAQRKNK